MYIFHSPSNDSSLTYLLSLVSFFQTNSDIQLQQHFRANGSSLLSRYSGICSVVLAFIVTLVLYASLPASAQHAPRVFYVSKNGPPDGDGSSWSRAFPELNRINWDAVQDAIWGNLDGASVPGWPHKVQVIVKLDGGPTGGFMVYKTQLHPTARGAGSPYEVYPVIVRATEAGHNGQVIIEGGGPGTDGLPGMDFSDQTNWYVAGNGDWTGWHADREAWWCGPAQPGIAVVGWAVGIYTGQPYYAAVSGVLAANNGVNFMAVHPIDIPGGVVAGQRLRVNTDMQYPNLGGCAGQGFHFEDCWFNNATSLDYHASCVAGNSNYGAFPPDHHFPYGYPEFIRCIIGYCRRDSNLGRFDGIRYMNAYNQTGYHPFLVRSCILGPENKRSIVIEQDNALVFSHGNLYINPYEANMVKHLAGDDEVVYMAHCVSAMTHLNRHGAAHSFVDMIQGDNDKITSCVIDGGAIRINGRRALGPNIERSRTTGNGILLSPADVPSRLATDFSRIANDVSPQDLMALDYSVPADSALYRASPWTESFGTWSSMAAFFGLPVGTRIGQGFASGYRPPPGPNSGTGSGGGITAVSEPNDLPPSTPGRQQPGGTSGRDSSAKRIGRDGIIPSSPGRSSGGSVRDGSAKPIGSGGIIPVSPGRPSGSSARDNPAKRIGSGGILPDSLGR